jgi:hypothetical protein
MARTAEEDVPRGFKPLLNGKDLTGWKAYGGKREVWGAEKGLLFAKGADGGWLLTDKEFSDFELRLEYRWEKDGGNSGVAVRAPLVDDVSWKGIEIQLIDDVHYEQVHNYKLKPTQHTGSIYGVVPPPSYRAKAPANGTRCASSPRAVKSRSS